MHSFVLLSLSFLYVFLYFHILLTLTFMHSLLLLSLSFFGFPLFFLFYFYFYAFACATLVFFSFILVHIFYLSFLCTCLCYSHFLLFPPPLLFQLCYFLSFKGKFFSSRFPLKELELELHLFPTTPTPGLPVKLGILLQDVNNCGERKERISRLVLWGEVDARMTMKYYFFMIFLSEHDTRHFQVLESKLMTSHPPISDKNN